MSYFNWKCPTSDNESLSSDDTDYLINTPCNVDVSDFESEVLSSSNVINKTLNNVVSSYFSDKKPSSSSIKQKPKSVVGEKLRHHRSKSFEEKVTRRRSGDVYYVNDSVILSVSFGKLVIPLEKNLLKGENILNLRIFCSYLLKILFFRLM